MNKTIEWIKANVFIVIFGALILAAFIVLPILSSGMNRSVTESLTQRKKAANDLIGLTNTGIDLRDPSPSFQRPDKTTALINPAALREFREYTEERISETEQLRTEAERFNEQDHRILVPKLFPQPAVHERETLIGDMSVALVVAYQSLLQQINAGTPPTLQSMQSDLLRLQRQIVSTMAKSNVEELSAGERTKLQEALSEQRLSIATEAARRIGVYASLDTINPPSWKLGEPIPAPSELFQWQWDYWVIKDLMDAIGHANENASSVLDAPVKRIRSIQMIETPGGAATRDRRDRPRRPAQPGGGNTGGGPFISGGGTGMGGGDVGSGGRFGGERPGKTETPAGQPFNPAQEVARDYNASFTGRTTNPLYDVRYTRIQLVVETSRIPEVLDAIAHENFMTVVSLDLWPADPYADLVSGYVYGGAATSELVLDVESIWLRSWTSPFMPDELKTTLGIPLNTESEGSATQAGS